MLYDNFIGIPKEVCQVEFCQECGLPFGKAQHFLTKNNFVLCFNCFRKPRKALRGRKHKGRG